MPLNPFIWEYAIEDGVPREAFARETALQLEAGTHVALFGPRGTGKTSFTLELRRELGRDHEADAPPWQMLRIDLRRAISLPAFIGAIRNALDRHPLEVGVPLREIGFALSRSRKSSSSR